MSVMDLSPALCRVFCAFNNPKIRHLKDDLLILASYLSFPTVLNGTSTIAIMFFEAYT